MAKSKENCTKELKRVVEEMAKAIGKPYDEAKNDLMNIRKDGKKVLSACTDDVKAAFDDSCKKVEKMLEVAHKSGLGTSEALQQGAKTLYEEALRQLRD